MSVEQSLLVSAIIVLVAFTPTVGGQGQCGQSTLLATGFGQNLTSPNYPFSYPSYLDCEWNIEAESSSGVVMMRVLDLRLYSSYYTSDKVTLYDGANTGYPVITVLTGQANKAQYTSTGPYMTVEFRSSSSLSNGFNMTYASVEKSAKCDNTSLLLATPSAQNITSPGYPRIYPSSLTCEWTISADSASRVIVLSVLELFTSEVGIQDCDNNYVDVYDGNSTNAPRTRICDQAVEKQMISAGPDMTVVFRSNSPFYIDGFQLEYMSLEMSDVCSYVSLEANGTVQYITSPGYPNNYPRYMTCQWSISANDSSVVIVLKVVDLGFELTSPACTQDFVSIYDGPSRYNPKIQDLCGQMSNTQFVSSGPSMTVVLNSEGTLSNRRFKLGYITLDKSDVCSNGPLLATQDVDYITSPNYPGNHPSNTRCQWNIQADTASRVVVLKSLDFILPSISGWCPNSSVAIYDGYSTSSPRISSLSCGLVISASAQFISTGPYMTVEFRSDEASGQRGFKFMYTSQEQSDTCENVTLSATEAGQYFTSTGYPNIYLSNMNCQWTISANSPTKVVVLTLLEFELEDSLPSCIFDFISIYDGPGTSSPLTPRLCGHVPSTRFISTGPVVTVVFHSDKSTDFRGFKIEYSSQQSGRCTNNRLTATETGQLITSPGYPNNYPNNTDCVWSISAEYSSRVVALKLLDFHTEGTSPSCASDYVAVYDGPSSSSPRIHLLCGQVANTQFISTGPSMTVMFHSDKSNNYKGFKIEFTTIESGPCTNASLSAVKSSGYITSPGYPNNYPSKRSCQWTISADTPTRVVVLKVLDFELEGAQPNCSFDYVAVYDGSSTDSPRTRLMCGQVSSSQVISTGPSMTVVFYTDDSSSFRGFKLEYNAQESDLCANVQLQAKETGQYISSQGYPNKYPRNIGCRWSISANSTRRVVLTVLDFELEGSQPACSFDYVAVYDGSSTDSPRIQLLCGHVESAQITSTGAYLTVVFQSDSSIDNKGFKLEYISH